MGELVSLDAYRGKPADAEPLATSGGGGDFSGMDPWQQTVETRLGELRTDLRAVSVDVTAIKTDVATLKERVSALPSKEFIVKVGGGFFALLAAATLFGPNLRALLGLH